jgi:hypothetical protein
VEQGKPWVKQRSCGRGYSHAGSRWEIGGLGHSRSEKSHLAFRTHGERRKEWLVELENIRFILFPLTSPWLPLDP